MFDTLESADRSLLLWVNSMHSPLFDEFMWFMSQTWPTVLIVFAVTYAFHRKFSAKKAIAFLLGCAIVFACTDLSSNAVKHGVKRYRPTHNLEIKDQIHRVNEYEGGKYGFISNHAANTFGVITFIILCVKWLEWRYRLLLLLYPLTVCYSRMYLGVHYPSDVIVGMFSGVTFGTIVYFVMNRHFLKLHEEVS